MSEPGGPDQVSEAASYAVDGVVPANVVRPTSVEALSAALEVNSTVRKLYLGGNQITEVGRKLLTEFECVSFA